MHSLEDWHKIIGHCNVDDILKLEKNVEGMQITDRNKFKCEIYPQAKMSQSRNRLPDTRATKIQEMVHVDLATPIDLIANDGFKCILGCIDDYSGLIVTYMLINKSDALKAFEKFIADISPYGSFKYVRTDQGTEFTSGAFESILIKNKIDHQKTSPYSPHQNGTIERAWRTNFWKRLDVF